MDDDHDDHADHLDEHDHGDEDIRLQMEQTRYDAVLHLHSPIDAIEVVRSFVSYTDYEHAELEGVDVGTVYASDSVEARIEAVHAQIGDLHGVFGLQASSTEFSAVGAESFVPETDIRRTGLFVLEDWHQGHWQVEAGIRLDRDELDPTMAGAPAHDFSALSASLGLIYEVNPAWHVSTSISRAERAPAVEELYSNYGNVDDHDWVTHAATGAIELGNTELDTELGYNWDVGVTMHQGAHSARFAFYVNDFDRFINLANTGLEVDMTPVRRYEQEGAQFIGLEFDGDWSLGGLAGGAVMLETDVDWVEGELDSGGDVPRLPPLTGKLGLVWSDDSSDYYTRFTAASKQDNPGAFEEPTDSWTRLDLGAQWRLAAMGGDVVLSLALRNVTDEEIRLSTSWLREYAPEMGRSLDLGFRLEL